ncbi:hypothetical protein AT05_11585 [Schleiferia thermophila str. Yellowstone]|nr:hypothetical protein AT05_11585 [Schleiferia thermophila str. Yellowstone]
MSRSGRAVWHTGEEAERQQATAAQCARPDPQGE